MNQPTIRYTVKAVRHVEAAAELDGRTMVGKGSSREDSFYALRNMVVQMLMHRGLMYAADDVGRTWKYVETE